MRNLTAVMQWIQDTTERLSKPEKLRRALEESLRNHYMIKLHRFELRRDFLWISGEIEVGNI